MSIDTTFKPVTATYRFDNSAAVQVKEAAQGGCSTFRIKNLDPARQWFTWGPAGIAAAVAPALGTQSPNTIGLEPGGVIYIEVPAASFFRGSIVTTGFEVTGGQGGIGG